MNRAGIETWLMNVMRRIDRDRYRFDFMVDEGIEGDFDDEIRQLGGEIIPIMSRRQPGFTKRVSKLIRERGGYDVVHGHLNLFNTRVLKAARAASVPVRISHSHTDRRSVERSSSALRRVANQWMRVGLRRHMTIGLCVSPAARLSMFGKAGEADDRCRVSFCGIDCSSFEDHTLSTPAIRQEFGIPEDAWVIGHVGRLVAVKNHSLMIRVLHELTLQSSAIHLLLVGDGELRSQITEEAMELNIADRVHFAGARDDIPQILIHGVDAFIFPSILEGLPVALLEAQAAGLPCVVSDQVTAAADVVEELITRLPIEGTPNSVTPLWAEAFQATRTRSRDYRRALAAIKKSPFAIENGILELTRVYDKALDGSNSV